MRIMFCIFLVLVLSKSIDGILIGRIQQASILTNTSMITTSDSKCLDCLCNCLINKKCYGINCFPSNKSCQQIEQEWIQENQLSYDLTSDKFINTIDLHFCSCYSSQNILNKYQNISPIAINHPTVRYILYNSYDNTLIVLGNSLIGQYYVSNLTRFRNWSVSSIPLIVFNDSTQIFISFFNNASINRYDLSMNYIQSIKRPTGFGSNSGLYGMDRWKNLLLVSDQPLYLIWSVNLTTMNMSIYLNLTSYNIKPFSLAVFNNYLYISQSSSSILYIFDLNLFVMTNVIFSNSVPLYRLQKDSYCNRLWFGVNQTNYSSVPVLDLFLNQPKIYQSKGILSTTTVYLTTFDSNYSMYTTAIDTDYFYKFPMTSMNCDIQ